MSAKQRPIHDDLLSKLRADAKSLGISWDDVVSEAGLSKASRSRLANGRAGIATMAAVRGALENLSRGADDAPIATPASVPDAYSSLQARLDLERGRAHRSISGQLRDLRHRIDSAFADLDAGRPIDAHMIANSVMLTSDIARWNTVLSLQPYVDRPDHGEIKR